MPAATAIKPLPTIQAEVQAEVVTTTRGLLQLKKQEHNWLCSPVIYNAKLSFAPALISEERVLALFELVNLGQPILDQHSMIAEFFDSPVTIEAIEQFGFRIAA